MTRLRSRPATKQRETSARADDRKPGSVSRGEKGRSPRAWLGPMIVVVMLGLVAWFGGAVPDETAIKADADEVLLVLPTLGDGESRRERQLRAVLKETPGDIASITALAQLYIERARRDSDPRYLGYTQQLLAPWWNAVAPPPSVLRMRAILRQAQHDFDAALADLDALLESDPADAQALLTRATLHRVTGNYRMALADCRRLARFAALYAVTCSASIMALTGHAESAQQSMAQLGPQLTRQPVETRQWLLTIQGEIAERAGRFDQADEIYALALAEPQRSAYLLRVYARSLLRRDDAEAVLELLHNEVHDDNLLLLAAVAAHRLGDDARLAAYRKLIDTRLRNARLRGGRDHHYLAGYYALEIEGSPRAALRHARANWSRSKEASDTELFAAAAVAAGDRDALREIEHWMTSQGAKLAEVSTLIDSTGGSRK